MLFRDLDLPGWPCMATVGCILANEQLFRLQDTRAIGAIRRGWRASCGRDEANVVDRRVTDDRLSAQPIKILLHEIAAHLGDVGVGEALGDRTGRPAVADLGAVESAHAGDAEARGSQEHLFGVRRVEQIDVAFNDWNGELVRGIERHLAADAGKDVTLARGISLALPDHKYL